MATPGVQMCDDKGGRGGKMTGLRGMFTKTQQDLATNVMERRGWNIPR